MRIVCGIDSREIVVDDVVPSRRSVTHGDSKAIGIRINGIPDNGYHSNRLNTRAVVMDRVIADGSLAISSPSINPPRNSNGVVRVHQIAVHGHTVADNADSVVAVGVNGIIPDQATITIDADPF